MSEPMKGIGGAPCRATIIPADAKQRKTFPIASGLLDYFPDALAVVSNLSHVANEQHNPGQPLHWARGKSQDEADTMMRHFVQRGTLDSDGIRHSAKVAWRALALLQKEIESEKLIDPGYPPLEYAAEYPKYYAHTDSHIHTIYRALFPDDIGSYWGHSHCWNRCSGGPLSQWVYGVLITREQAAAAGVPV